MHPIVVRMEKPCRHLQLGWEVQSIDMDIAIVHPLDSSSCTRVISSYLPLPLFHGCLRFALSAPLSADRSLFFLLRRDSPGSEN